MMWRWFVLVVGILLFWQPVLEADEAAEATSASKADLSADDLFRAGQYDQAMQLAAAEFDKGVWNEKWPKLLIRCQLTRGRYADAYQTYQAAIARYTSSLSLRLLGREVLLMNNRLDEAEKEADQIFEILQQTSSRYASAESLVAAGRYFVLRGEDARQVLTMFYDRVRVADPKNLEVRLATAELGIEKGDFKVAADTLGTASADDQLDPRVGHLRALAWQTSDPAKAQAAIEQSLSVNPNFIPSLLFNVERDTDAERYQEALDGIAKVLKTNPHQAEAWAYLSVIAHLRGEYEREPLMRAAALSTWSRDPEVDHLIGRKLSDHYRFAEGAEYQRRALAMNSGYTRAQFQLANDLLRLGDADIGWQLAEQVNQTDPYNVVAHNLMLLSDHMKKFTLIESDEIHVRMDADEAEIYGDRVLHLLREAKQVLCAKYDVKPRRPIVVEIYPQQKDFAIRTFGLPGGADFLGVCFGRVITANSPASQGPRPSNWESVLWHEFCHAVTLEKTQNRMPRWLSEGISVYEETCRDLSWGQSLTPTFRTMLMSEKLTPVSELSTAFIRPPSPTHLQFAYYHAGLVVEYFVERFGMDALNELLVELGNGVAINEAIGRVIQPLERVDLEFAEYATKHAKAYGWAADWSRDVLPPASATTENVWQLIKSADDLVKNKQWSQARIPLEKLVDLNVIDSNRNGPLEQLATVYRELNDTAKEHRTLVDLNERSSDCLPAIARLIELAKERNDWLTVTTLARKYLAVQPLMAGGYEALADAAEHQEDTGQAIAALIVLQKLKPVDPAGLNLRLASLQMRAGDQKSAKRNVLQALELAPRFRAAHRLLLELNE